MANLYTRLMAVLTWSSVSPLRAQLRYHKAENQILRAKIHVPVRVTPQERARLVKLGAPLGRAIHTLISMVKPLQAAGQLGTLTDLTTIITETGGRSSLPLILARPAWMWDGT